ncbi:MAG TPA: alcohol dehydrogenase catalytic domain-containing protein [Chloroflexota bacterium]
MKAVVYHGGTEVRLENLPVPTAGPGEVLVKTAYAGVCGSDVTIYTGKHKRVKPPITFGHELSGIVEAVGEGVEDLKPGDAVVVEPLVPCGKCYACLSGSYNVCRNLRHLGIDIPGMFAEYVLAGAGKVYKLPDGLSVKDAALVEPTAVGVHAVRRAGARLGHRVTVLGGGPIGLLCAQVARVATASPVEIVEVSDWRLDLARKLGFDPIDAKKTDVLQEVLARTGGKGADVVIETAGVAATAQLLPLLARIHGVVAMVAMPKEPVPVDFTAFDLKEVGFVSSRAYMRPDYETAIELIASGKVDAAAMVSHVLPLDEWHQGLELAKAGNSSMKVLLTP